MHLITKINPNALDTLAAKENCFHKPFKTIKTQNIQVHQAASSRLSGRHTYIHTYIKALLKWWHNASIWQWRNAAGFSWFSGPISERVGHRRCIGLHAMTPQTFRQSLTNFLTVGPTDINMLGTNGITAWKITWHANGAHYVHVSQSRRCRPTWLVQ